MSDLLKKLQKSLEKKEAELERRFAVHFASVREANGQPLNDKRNGKATLSKWDRQSDGIRRQQTEIERTKSAIEKEEGRAVRVLNANATLPPVILDALHAGVITQWAKHPTIFFVPGVEKARIGWDDKVGLYHKYVATITDPVQRRTFAQTFNSLKKQTATP